MKTLLTRFVQRHRRRRALRRMVRLLVEIETLNRPEGATGP
jgi:hypothetical protein